MPAQPFEMSCLTDALSNLLEQFLVRRQHACFVLAALYICGVSKATASVACTTSHLVSKVVGMFICKSYILQASSSASTQAIPESEPAAVAAQPAASEAPGSPAAPEQPSSHAGAAAHPGVEPAVAQSAEQTTKQVPQSAVQQQVPVR